VNPGTHEGIYLSINSGEDLYTYDVYIVIFNIFLLCSRDNHALLFTWMHSVNLQNNKHSGNIEYRRYW
jgi:hypothetical protein